MSMRIDLRVIGLFLLGVVLGSSPGSSQQRSQQAPRQQEPPPTFRAASNLVLVDITIRDRKGNLISDLKKEDFKIFEDNALQEIVTFSLENIPVAAPPNVAEAQPNAPVAPKPATAPPTPVINLNGVSRYEVKKEELKDKRLVILYFDLASLQTEDLLRSLNTAQEYIEKKSSPGDLLAVATYSSTLTVLQNFTNDHEVLLKTLKQLNPTETGDAGGDDLGDQESSDDVYVPDDVQFNIFNTDRRLSSIETLAKMYREYPERKSLIYFSSGVTTTGIENQVQIRSTVDVANQSNMTIYTVDSRGLDALPPGGGASRGSAGGRGMFTGDSARSQSRSLSSSQETLSTLAHDTGGTSFQDTNELAPVFDKVVSDTQTYYVLGYYSTNSKEDGKFRKIRVELSRPELKIQHRPGYFASKQFTRLSQGERERQLEEALGVDRPFSELPFILQAKYFKFDNTMCRVPLTLQIAGDGIQFEEKGKERQAQFEFLAQIKDPKGKIAGVARDNVTVRLPIPTAEKIRSGQILYTTNFDLRPGSYNLKFIIRDNKTGKLGSFEEPLTVPAIDGKSLQTSSVVLGNRLVDAKEGSSVQHRINTERFGSDGPGGHGGPGGRGGRGGPFGAMRNDPLTIDDKKIVPSIGNIFVSRQTLYVYFQVYGIGEDPATKKPNVETRLLFLQEKSKKFESQAKVHSEWTTGEKGVATVTMSVPLRGFKKGNYTLQVHVRDNVSDSNLFQRVQLVVN